MEPQPDNPRLPWEPVEALGVFMGLLAEAEAATPASTQFYDRLCEATCRLAHLRRAVVFLWDDAKREVRAVGSFEVPIHVFSRTYVNTANVPIAREALARDRVVEVHEDFGEWMPQQFVDLLQPRNLVCTPMSAGGLWYGVLMAERERDEPLTDAESHTLWTLGKVAGLAASVRIATRQQDRARRLNERLDLARAVHEQVIQRLFGVSMVLGAEHEMPAAERARCAEEIRSALADLRAALVESVTVHDDHPRLFDDELAHALRVHDALPITLSREAHAAPSGDHQALAASVLAEALRNVAKHATPTRVDVTIASEGDAFTLAVNNDGASPGTASGGGMGLRIASLEAVHGGGVLEYGPRGRDGWHVRLVLP